MALTKLSTDVIDLSDNTEALTIPSGTTGNISLTVDYLIVAGGGGGGAYNPGGAGAGGLRTSYGTTSGGGAASESSLALTSGSTYTVIVGEGGAGGITGSGDQKGVNGGDSSFNSLTSLGGGGGASRTGTAAESTGKTGGSGGGSGSGIVSSVSGGLGTAGQGYDGGVSSNGTDGYRGSGGGGAGGIGGTSGTSGLGGISLSVAITGSSTSYSKGGRGGNNNSSNVGASGAVNTGNGGDGGAGAGTSAGGSGGSGIVILRYSNIFTATYTAGTGGTADSEVTVGTDKYIKITAGTGTVTFSGAPTTTGRPSSPTEGLMRENTTTGKMEFYDGSLWQEITDTASSYSPGLIPAANFNTVLYPGNGGTKSVTGVGFKPGLNWIKQRNGSASHSLQDIVRGPGQNFNLYSDNTESQGAYGVYGYMSSFDDDGFTVEVASGSHTNNGSTNYVSWNWKAGGAATTIASGTNGSTVASDVSANQAAGFSIVKYTTAGVQTISHGLSKAPEIIINKISNASVNWNVYTQTTGTGHLLKLNLGDATAADSVFMTAVGADTFSTKWSDGSYNYINYCWHSVPGYSKIGFYVGNLNSTGPIVYTGFKPAWLMIKSTGADNWIMLDNKRSTSNPRQAALFANLSDAEYPTYGANVNFLDTGFQIVNTDGVTNALGVTYIYMTFSE